MVLLIRGNVVQSLTQYNAVPDGNVASPGLSFAHAPTTGLSRSAEGNVVVSVGGTAAMDVSTVGITANAFVGDGAGLSNIAAGNVTGLTAALDVIDASSVSSNVVYGGISGDLQIGANLVPTSNVAFNLGTELLRFKDLYLSGNTIDLGGSLIQSVLGNVVIGNLDVTNIRGNGSHLTGVQSALSISNVQITSNTYEVLDDTAVGLDGGYCLVNGEGFAGGCLVQVDGTNASATSFVSTTQLRFEAPPKMAGSYNVSVIRGDTTTAILPSALTYSNAVTFTTPSGLGNIFVDESFSIQLNATSDSQITYSNISALPPLTTLSASGQLAGNITSNVVSNSTLYSLDVLAEDQELQDSQRTFLLQLIVLLVSAIQYTNSSWQPLTQTALDSNVSGVYWTISGTGFAYISSITVGGTAVTNYAAMSDSQVIVQGPQKVTGTYDVVITTAAGTKTFADAVTYSDVPVWSTGSTLGNVYQNNPFSFPLVATSDSTITYANTGALPTGISLISGNVTGNITQALTGAANAPYSSSGSIVHDSLYTDFSTSPVQLTMSSTSGMTFDAVAYELTATVDGRITISVCFITNKMPGCDTQLSWAISVDGVYETPNTTTPKAANINVGSKIRVVVYPEFSPGGLRQIYNASTLSYTIAAEQVYSIGMMATDQELQSTERTFTLTYIG